MCEASFHLELSKGILKGKKVEISTSKILHMDDPLFIRMEIWGTWLALPLEEKSYRGL